jgi:hypothetical protein
LESAWNLQFIKIERIWNMKDKKEISISQSIVNKEGGIVILSLREYQKLCAKTVPTYYLEGREAEEIDSLVKEGLRAYRKGKSKKIRSLADID